MISGESLLLFEISSFNEWENLKFEIVAQQHFFLEDIPKSFPFFFSFASYVPFSYFTSKRLFFLYYVQIKLITLNISVVIFYKNIQLWILNYWSNLILAFVPNTSFLLEITTSLAILQADHLSHSSKFWLLSSLGVTLYLHISMGVAING